MSSEFFESWLPALLLRGIVLGCLFAGLAVFFRKTSSDRMSVWWRCGVVALLVVAFIPWTAVRWWIPVERAASVVSVESSPQQVRGIPVQQRPTPGIEPPDSKRPLALTSLTAPILDKLAFEPPSESAKPALSWWAWTWMLGAAVILWRFFASLCRVGTMIRAAGPVPDSKVIDLLNVECGEIGIRRSVGIKSHPEIDAPFVTGFFRPVIVLPKSAERMDETALRLILRHELAHVARLDVPWQLAAELAVAFHWMNPFVWIIRRRLRLAHEAAADDVVLGGGVTGLDYASVLFGMACDEGGFSNSPCLAPMARVSTLRTRIGFILDARRRRDAIRPAAQWALAGISCGIALIFGLTGVRAQLAPAALAPLGDESWSRSYRDTFILEGSFTQHFPGTSIEALAGLKKELTAGGVHLDNSIKLELSADKTALNVEFAEFDRPIVERQLARFIERAGWWRDASERQKAAVESAMWVELETQRKRMEEAGKRMTAARLAGNIVDRAPDNPRSTISITYPAASSSVPESKPSKERADIADVPFTLTGQNLSLAPLPSVALESVLVDGGIIVSSGTVPIEGILGVKVNPESGKERREEGAQKVSEYFTAKRLYLHEKKVYEEMKQKNQ